MNTPLELILSRLSNPQKHGDSYTATCPAHDDKSPSLSLSLGDDGSALIHCHAGCKTEDVLSAIGFEMRDLFPSDISSESPRRTPAISPTKALEWLPVVPIPTESMGKIPLAHPKYGAPSDMWIYRNPSGDPMMVTYRFDLEPDDSGTSRKTFAQLTWCQNAKTGLKEWRWQSLPPLHPLLNLNKLAAQPTAPVVINEGEKAADAAAELLPGYVATCWPNGSSSWQKADFAPLAGRDVLLWPDNDAPGLKCMDALAEHLRKIGVASMRIVNLSVFSLRPGLDGKRPTFAQGGEWGKGDDAADALVKGWTAAHFAELERTGKLFATEPEPIPLLPELEKAAPYPLDALGDLLGDAAKAIIKCVQVPDAIAAQSVLAAAAMAAQAHGNVQRAGQLIPLSLFALTVAESGDRKSTADRLALKAHQEHQRKLLNEYKDASKDYRHERDAHQVARTSILNKNKRDAKAAATSLGELEEPEAPPLPFILSEEPTIEGLEKSLLHGHPSQGLFSDEGGQFFGGYSAKPENKLKSVAWLSKRWDGDPITRTRAAEGENSARYGCRLSAHLMIQPIVATSVLADPLMQGQGFLARFLIAWPESLAGTRLYRDVDPSKDKCLGDYHKRITKLLEKEPTKDERGELTPPTLTLSPVALRAWITEYDAIERQLGCGGDMKAIKPTAAKGAENLLRIAGVFAVIEGHQTIHPGLIERAAVLMHWYLAEALRLTIPTQVNPQLLQAQHLLDWVKSRGWHEFHRDQLGAQGPTRGNAKLRDELLAILLSHYQVLSADGKNFQLNLGQSAESADSAETQQYCSFAITEEVQTSAEPQVPSAESAPVCTLSALSAPSNSGVSALSAHSAAPCDSPPQPSEPETTELVATVANPAKFRGEI